MDLLVLSSIPDKQSFANLGGAITQMCGLLMTSGERLNTMSLMTFLPEQRVWNPYNQDTDNLCPITRSWWVWDPSAYHWAGEDSKSSRMLTLSLVRTQMTSLMTSHWTSSDDVFCTDICQVIHRHPTKIHKVHSTSHIECRLDQKWKWKYGHQSWCMLEWYWTMTQPPCHELFCSCGFR